MMGRKRSPEATKTRSPPAFSVVIALTWASARSRTSTQFPPGVAVGDFFPLIRA